MTHAPAIAFLTEPMRAGPAAADGHAGATRGVAAGGSGTTAA